MVIFFSISSGLIIIVISIVLIKREFQKAFRFRNSNFSGLSDSNVKEVISYLDKLESTVEEMNQSFYDIANDLEEKYSMHNKEIEIIDQKVNDINLLTKELSKLVSFQGKELALIKRNEEVKSLSKSKRSSQSINITEEEFLTIKDGQTESLSNDNKDIECNNLSEEILKLKALGMDVNQIAKKLNKGVREIEMLMSFIK